MKTLFAAFVSLLVLSSGAMAAPAVGQPAPDFMGTDSNGNTIKLSDLAGQKVILEWTNHDCPYVRKHYDTRNMQNTQAVAKASGYSWIQVVSSKVGAQGYVEPDEANAITAREEAIIDAKILDPSGTIGRAYDAKTTPHMYIIDEEGTLIYMGGIDDKPTARHSDIDGAKNYVLAAIDDIDRGNSIEDAVTRPYGCTVKY